jgi:hypothetical protein
VKLGKLAKTARGDEWIIPRYEEYLRHRDMKAEAKYAKKILTRPERDRTIQWSASAQGTCLRAQQFTKHGTQKKRIDLKSLNIFANGEYMHLRHQVFGLAGGYLADVEVAVENTELCLAGTLDGVSIEGEGVEWKSINTYGFSSVGSFGPKQEHLFQVNAYMLMKPEIKAFRILYEDKNTNDLKEFRVERDEVIIDKILTDLDALNRAEEEKTMLPILRECKNLEGRYRWCPYSETCLKDL